MKPKLDLKRIRELMRKYPLASAAVAGGIALLLGWQVYQVVGTRRAAAPVAVAPPAPTAPAPSKAPMPGTPGAPGPAAPGPAAPGPAATPGAPGNPPTPPVAAGGIQQPAGRADPFAPLVATGGGGGGRPALPPVPVLGPGGIPLPGVPFPPGGGEGGLRVAGIIWDRGAIAIMVDERGSYIVAPGDEVTPGLRVVRIDVGRKVVQVQRSGGMEELTLQGRGGAGQ